MTFLIILYNDVLQSTQLLDDVAFHQHIPHILPTGSTRTTHSQRVEKQSEHYMHNRMHFTLLPPLITGTLCTFYFLLLKLPYVYVLLLTQSVVSSTD